MSKGKIITGLDIGTSMVRVVVASFKGSEEKPKIIGIGEAPSSGIRRGIVVDIEEVVASIKKAVEEAELNSGIPIRNASLSIGGNHISIKKNKGLVAVSRADQEVSEEDISRVIASASAISLPLNREMIHVIPRDFKLDSEEGILDPLGMTGARLEVDALVIDGLAPHIKNLTKCVSILGIKVDGLVLNVLAASQAVLSKRQKELGVLVLDLGGGTSSMAVYEEGKLFHAQVLPVGSSHITNDIAIGFQTTIDLAEKIKLQYGSALPGEIKKKDIINLSELDASENSVFSRQEVSRIIEARIQEIFDLVNRELKRIGKQKLLPAGIVLVGAGSLMPGIVDLAKREFGLPAELGFPSQIESVMERVNDPSFATAAGLVLWGIQMKGNGGRKGSFSDVPSVFRTIGKIKKWVKSFIIP